MPRPRRCRLAVLALLLGLATTGCQVTLATRITVGRDGHGTVNAGVGLDTEALQQVGDLAAALRVDDLRSAGWTVVGPRKEDDGLTWMRVSKRFADAEEATAALAQLSGPDGPFRELRLTRARGLLRTKTSFTGKVDLANGLAGLSDPALAATLADVDLGLDVEGLKKRFGDDLARAVRVEVVADLPGRVETNAPRRSGDRAVWAPELGQGLEVRAESEAFNVVALAGITLAMLAVLTVGLVLAVRAGLRRRAMR